MGDILSVDGASWDARVGGDARAGAAGSARDPSGVAWDDGDAARPMRRPRGGRRMVNG